jgi:adenylosuccinate synthase
VNATVIGSQFGDEGKGSTVDLFGDAADVVVRYQGGGNAGHTVTAEGETYELRLVPSGVVGGATGVLGNGCVVDLETLFDELDRLRGRGLDPEVLLSEAAHVVFPYHRVVDEAEEAAKDESGSAVGTTGNGIGPAYADRGNRRGIRAGELSFPDVLRERIEGTVSTKRTELSALGGDPGASFDVDRLVERFTNYGERLDDEGMLVDAGRYLTDRDQAGDTLLFEGAQGTAIDLDHGNYPFVTSSNPTVGGAIVGTGVSPSIVADGSVVGVVKAYLTRVGRGAMPTEFDPETAARRREALGEFGTVTGRPRRLGWLDLPILRRAARINGYTGLVLNHVDALATFDELRVCTAYQLEGERLAEPPSEAGAWQRCEPEYESFDPWPDNDWAAVADAGYEALPDTAQRYVEFVADEVGVPVDAIGVGPAREETIVRNHPLRGDDEPRTDVESVEANGGV